MITPALTTRSRTLFNRYDLGCFDDYEEDDDGLTKGDCVFGGDLGILEHLIHELAHARCLGLRLGPNLSQRITSAINSDPCADNQLVQEAMTWAIEWHCVQLIGLPFEWGDITAGAEVQGIEAHDVKKHVDAPWSRRVARNVLRHLLRGVRA